MKKKFNYLLAFIVPIILMILLYMAVGVIGGNKNILTVDLQDQYIEFFNALKNIFDGIIVNNFRLNVFRSTLFPAIQQHHTAAIATSFRLRSSRISE